METANFCSRVNFLERVNVLSPEIDKLLPGTIRSFTKKEITKSVHRLAKSSTPSANTESKTGRHPVTFM